MTPREPRGAVEVRAEEVLALSSDLAAILLDTLFSAVPHGPGPRRVVIEERPDGVAVLRGLEAFTAEYGDSGPIDGLRLTGPVES